MFRFDGKVAVVVGGGSGIGRAAAQIFAAQGASVAVADLNEAGAIDTVKSIAGNGAVASSHTCDVTDYEQVKALVDEVVSQYGRLDAMTSTVGWSDTTFFQQEGPEYWERIVRINYMGAIYVSRAAVDYMSTQRSGAIVLTSSDAGKVGTMGETVYAGAKAGVIGFVKSLAREIARDGLRINAVSPGPTDTPLLRAQSDQHVIDKMIRAVPLKRMGQPEEPGAAIAYLASDEASYITGQTLSVSGGLTMTS